MISLTPSGSPAETNFVVALLDVIANPERAKKHLESLIAEKEAAIEAHALVKKAQAEAKKESEAALAKIAKAHAAASEAQEAADKKLAEALRIKSDNDARSQTMDDRHHALVEKDKRLTAYEASLSSHESEITNKLDIRQREADSDIANRESALKKREQNVAALEASAQEFKNEYERKLSALKAAMK